MRVHAVHDLIATLLALCAAFRIGKVDALQGHHVEHGLRRHEQSYVHIMHARYAFIVLLSYLSIHLA